ncbi:MAG: dipeptide ABC transporter ATP-binding protein [Candidatus Promineifilaceae bacterium]
MTEPALPMRANQSCDVLVIDGLTVAYQQDGIWLNAVQDFSLTLASGQTYGLVGESGSGKTTVALAVMRYLGTSGRVLEGHIDFAGRDLLALGSSEMERIWGAEMALVPQDPLSSLNPSITIGEQMAEILRHHRDMSHQDAAGEARNLLISVRVPDPDRVYNSYPHQISGGMQQRVLIAMALSTEPRLLVLDEPTTALDVTTQAVILDLFRELIRGRETAALYVTHNLGVVAQICDRVAVLYAGELVEDAAIADLFRRPLHPYTLGLLDSIPQPGDSKHSMSLQAIQGQIPSLSERPDACVFAPRCPYVIDLCHSERPKLERVNEGAFDDLRSVRCHRWPEILAGSIRGADIELGRPDLKSAKEAGGVEPVLDIEDLHIAFDLRRSLSQLLRREPPDQVLAVRGVDISIPKAKTLGLVGESGSGKTTIARAIIGLEESSAANMRLLTVNLPSGLSGRSREQLRQLQIVFQNPEEALNPYLTIGESLKRPLRTLRGISSTEADDEVARLLDAVRLPAGYAQRRPDQLSGGEKQRAAIARAFAANPDLFIADEPVSALDVSVQASILNLLSDLQETRGVGTLFISHDLAVVGYLADEVAVIYAGSLMEVAGSGDLFDPPHHPYTEALLSAIPHIDPEIKSDPIRLEGDVPDQMNVPQGCPFHPRCPRYAQMKDSLGKICQSQAPPWQETSSGKRIYCHIPTAELKEIQEKSQ